MDVKRSPVPLPDNATCTPVLVKVFFCYVYSDFHYDKSVFSDDHIQIIRSDPVPNQDFFLPSRPFGGFGSRSR